MELIASEPEVKESAEVSTSSVLDAYTQPGRNFSVSLALRY